MLYVCAMCLPCTHLWTWCYYSMHMYNIRSFIYWSLFINFTIVLYLYLLCIRTYDNILPLTFLYVFYHCHAFIYFYFNNRLIKFIYTSLPPHSKSQNSPLFVSTVFGMEAQHVPHPKSQNSPILLSGPLGLVCILRGTPTPKRKKYSMG